MINSYISSFVGPVIYKSSPSGANTGAIVGGTLGGIVFVVILVLGVIYMIRHTSTTEKEDPYLNPLPDVADLTNNGYASTHRNARESTDSSERYDMPTY